MQTAEKFTITFFFKLLVLFVLLIAGVVFKTTDLTKPVDARNLKPSPPATVTVTEPDSQQIQRLYFRMVSSETSASL